MESPLKWVCLAIGINEHLNATDIISGDLTRVNKSQCYWIKKKLNGETLPCTHWDLSRMLQASVHLT